MAAVSAEAQANTVPAFPAAEIEASIRSYLKDEAQLQSDLRGLSGRGSDGPRLGSQPVIDSLVVVSILCELESILPFEPPDTLVQAGGYSTIDAVVEHLLPQLEERWLRAHKENM